MRDITLEDTIYIDFTTRAFATGIPTVLAGSPVLSVLEENNATPITAGVSVSVSRASVVGLNMATVVATAANGYEAGKGYSLYISTGTVGGVSVVGEKVGEFTIGASAAAVDLANATDGLGALRTLLLDIPTVAEFEARTIVAASYFDPAVDTVALVTLVTTTTTLTNKTDFSLSTAGILAIWHQLTAAIVTADTIGKLIVDNLNATVSSRMPTTHIAATAGAVDVVTTNTDMRGTDSARLAATPIDVATIETIDATDQLLAAVEAGLDAAVAEIAQGVPGATPSIRDAVMLMYMALRNKLDVDTTSGAQLELHNSAGTRINKKEVTDDGTDYSEAKMTTGA